MNKTNKIQQFEMFHKVVGFSVTETKKVTMDGSELGIVKGFASTYDNIDRGGDIIRHGAFKMSLKRHADNNRQVRMFFQHDRLFPIGGFPINEISDNEKGLFVTGYINLKADKGSSTFELIKQGVISDFSIGYSVNESFHDDEENLNLTDIELWEISLVTEPMNTEANILEIKAVTSFRDLPLAPRDTVWNGAKAEKRVRKFTGAEEKPNIAYRNCFMWYDAEKQENFTAYKLLYCDVIDGKLKVVPRAIFEKAALLHGARRGINISEADKKKVAAHVNKYYEKMGLESPLKNSELAEHYKIIFDLLNDVDSENINTDINDFTSMKQIENYLKNQFSLSNLQRKTLISKIKSFSRDVQNDEDYQRDAESTEENEAINSNLIEKLENLEFISKLNSINSLLKGDQNVNT